MTETPSTPGRTLRPALGAAMLRVLYGAAPADRDYPSPVARAAQGNAVIAEALAANAPTLVGRFGSSELACVSFYTRWRENRRIRPGYPEGLRRVMSVNAGVFPTDDDALDRVARLYLEAASLADVMGVWSNRNEHRIVARCCPNARLVHLDSLLSMLFPQPWSSGLKGKNVLVVHPFAASVEAQYHTHRSQLFADPDVLPEFTLKTLAAVQSGAGNPCAFATWFDALDDMAQRISAIEFDVAIVGAGAYGLPLAAHVKRLGKTAIHMGGATQLLFGIRGRRWELESPDDVAPLFNEYWVRPSAEETPGASAQVEGGCYW